MVAAACEKSLDAPQPHMKKLSDDERGISWVSGPSIEPPDGLLAWLSTNATKPDGKRRRLRIPVVIHFDEHQLQITNAFLGVPSEASKGVTLHLDDSALGISLRDRLRKRCVKDELACTVWLEGYWGSLIGSDDKNRTTSPPYPFAVLDVLTESPTSTANVLVEQ